jgi:hypothetical protein
LVPNQEPSATQDGQRVKYRPTQQLSTTGIRVHTATELNFSSKMMQTYVAFMSNITGGHKSLRLTSIEILKSIHTRLIVLCRKHEKTLRPARWSDLRDPCCLDFDFSRAPEGLSPSDLNVGELIPHRSSTSTSPCQHLMPLVVGESSLLINSSKLAPETLTSVPSRLSLTSDVPSSFIATNLNANQYLQKKHYLFNI